LVTGGESAPGRGAFGVTPLPLEDAEMKTAQAASVVATVLRHMGAEVRKIEADDRYPHEQRQIATTDENAPLALIQLEMRVRRATIMRYAALLRGER